MSQPAPDLLPSPPQPAAPVSSWERVILMDSLRGFALLGVLISNVTFWFTGTSFLFPEYRHTLARVDLNSLVFMAVSFLVSGKFISLFSLLFGIGFAVQLSRAGRRGWAIGPTYARRLIVLLLIGIGHAVLLWYGDILILYSLLGWGLLWFARRSDSFILVSAGAFLVAIPLALVFPGVLMALIGTAPDPGISDMARIIAEENRAHLRLFSSGTYTEVVSANLQMLYKSWIRDGLILHFAPLIFGLFLLGLWAGKTGVLAQPQNHPALLRRLTSWGLALGLVGNALNLALYLRFDEAAILTDPRLLLLMMVGFIVGTVPMALFYAALFTRLHMNPRWRSRLDVFAPVGRMALSNYLLQTLLCLGIFYGIGLGLMGRPWQHIYLMISVTIFSGQLAWSRWWLRHHRFGPAEWVWRSLTYGRVQPLRRG